MQNSNTKTSNIEIVGAYAHNLKNIDANFPLGKITVVCGPSGCGKSSLVLDVLHAESRRRYLETLSHSAVAMLGGPKHVPVKAIHNLRPSIALECSDQKLTKKATVSSLAEIAPMLRTLFAECATAVCPECGREMRSLTPQLMVEKISAIKEGEKFQILAPVNVNNRTILELSKIYLAQGYVKAIADGNAISLDFLSKNTEAEIPKNFCLIIDRLISKANQRTRIFEAIESALRVSDNLVIVNDMYLSTIPRCEIHGCTAEPLEERHFSPWSKTGITETAKKSVWQNLSWEALHSKTVQELHEILPPLLEKIPERLKNTVLDIPLRIETLCELGLGHLGLGREADTLSGGEAQRVQLATLCTGHLNGILLCIDEPASGLHPIDVEKLWKVILKLKEKGNTIVLIEHNPIIINKADCIIEMGPGAGEEGGEIVHSPLLEGWQPKADGVCHGEWRMENDNAGKFILNSQFSILNYNIPLSAMTVICGVSGAGKSTLLWKTIQPYLESNNILHLSARTGRAFASKKSTIATAIDAMQILKNLFASMPESKIRGYSAAKFGTDKPGGRCETCKGEGYLLDPSGYEESECPICLGKRFRDDILEIRFKLMSIADVLNLTVAKALEVFENFENLTSKLKPLAQTGLHYLRLGQPTTHLSGGELQRLRLAQDLAKAKQPKTIYLFDEPARGLSLKDTALLLELLRGLTQKGNTVIAIEHNELFIRYADKIIEL